MIPSYLIVNKLAYFFGKETILTMPNWSGLVAIGYCDLSFSIHSSFTQEERMQVGDITADYRLQTVSESCLLSYIYSS